MIKKIKKFLLINSNTKQTIIKNTFWLGFGEITSRLLKIVIIFYAIRLLGASNWGAFSYAISLGTLFMIFSDIGISSILTREISKNTQQKKEYIATSTIIKVVLNILSFIAIIIIAPFFATENISKEIIVQVGIILVFDSLREFIFSLNRGMEKMESEAIVKIVTSLLLIIFTYIFLIKYENVYALSLGYALGSFAGFVYSLIHFRKYFKNIFRNFSKKLIKPLMVTAWPFAFFAILGTIMANTDSVMIGMIKNTEEVGYYATSLRIIFFLYIIPTLISTSLMPALSKKTEDKDEVKNIVNSSIKIINLIIIPIIFFSFFIGNDLITNIFGGQYVRSGEIFKISSISLLFIFPAIILNSVVFIFNKHGSIVKITLVGTILNILINIILIPKYGGVGAAVATLISQFVVLILIKNKLDKIIKINIFYKINKIIIATITSTAFLVIFKQSNLNIYIISSISIIIYLTTLLVLKEDIIYKIKNILHKHEE